MNQESLPTRLRVLRAEKGLTLREAARVTGLRSTTLSELERGLSHPRDVTLSRIAQGYGVPVSELIGMSEPEARPKASAPPPPEPESEAAGGERREEDYINRLLSAWGGSLWNTVHRWETAGYELQFAEISSILFDLEGLVATGLFQRSEPNDPTDVHEAKRDFELERIHKAVQRLGEAAEPVLEARAREKEAERLRREFKVIEGKTRRAA